MKGEELNNPEKAIINPKENLLANISLIKEKGVDFFKSEKFKEALSNFKQSRKLIEKELATEIENNDIEIVALYTKILKNEALTYHSLKEYHQANQNFDLILKILPNDEKTLELKLINYEAIWNCNKALKIVDYESFLKGEEVLIKLIEITSSPNDKAKYQEKLKEIQVNIKMQDPVYLQNIKTVEEFEKKCEKLKKDEIKLFKLLQVK